MKRAFLLLLAASLCAALCAPAAEVTADEARAAAARWLRDDPALGCRLGEGAEDVRTCAIDGAASFHVVKLAGGGFLVMSADTTREPVVAFAAADDLAETDDNPLWVLLKKDAALRAAAAAPVRGASLRAAAGGGSAQSDAEAKWAKLLGGGGMRKSSAQGAASVSDIRVAPLVQSKWNQSDVGGSPCYNSSTPGNRPCGCVATVGAQIMRYFQYPSVATSVAPFTNPRCKVDGVETPLTLQGGVYDWNLMPLVPDSSITPAARQAIGKLTSDIGVCVGMYYGTSSSSSSGYMLAEAFTNRFGYANALAAQWEGDVSRDEAVLQALLSNFDAKLPVALSLSGADGHEIVGDGYGYSDGTLYIHFNMGWGGLDDAWYAPPRMATSQYAFSILNGLVCNVFTNSAHAGGTICSGRVLDAAGAPVANAAVSAVRGGAGGSVVQQVATDANGIYALILPPGLYSLTAVSGEVSDRIDVRLEANLGTEIITDMTATDPVTFGLYYPVPAPELGNLCGQDIVLSGVESVEAPQFSPSACSFYPTVSVAISCSTPGALVRYTLDGSIPDESSAVYFGPVTLEDDTTLTAKAWKDGMNPSAIASAAYAYDVAQGGLKGDAFANPIPISGASGSRVVADNSSYTTESGEPTHTLQSGSCYNQYHTIWYRWTAPGSGRMTFLTKASDTSYRYQTAVAAYTGTTLTGLTRVGLGTQPTADDYATAVEVDVQEGTVYRIVGMVLNGAATGTFTLSWTGALTSEQTETKTDVPVSYEWLAHHFPGNTRADYEAIAQADVDGDGFVTWVEYLLDTDPIDPASRFTARIRMEGGRPVVEGNIDTNRLSSLGYRCVTRGKDELSPARDWEDVKSSHRFFKLFVER